MLARALVVLLVVLNLGVALWWALHTPPSASQSVVEPAGAARLQLLSEASPAVATAAPVEAASAPEVDSAPSVAPAPASTADADRCFRFGPFASAEAAQAASVLLQPVVRRARLSEEHAAPARGWRVYLPPAADAEAAQATAQRIAAAGFDDYFVVREGAEANAIALGRYRNEEGAHRRRQALAAAGFPVRIEPLGDARASAWLDVAAGASFDAARARDAIAAPYRHLDCAHLR